MSLPDHYRSETGRIWTTLCAFELDRIAALRWDEPEDEVTDEFNTFRCRALRTTILRGRDPAYEHDSIALVRVDYSARVPRLLMTVQTRGMVERWTPVTSDLSAKRRSYMVDGEKAELERWQCDALAIMRWARPRSEQHFALWRWEVALCSQGPIDPLLYTETHDASEDEI
jgi:hypothetical protein